MYKKILYKRLKGYIIIILFVSLVISMSILSFINNIIRGEIIFVGGIFNIPLPIYAMFMGLFLFSAYKLTDTMKKIKNIKDVLGINTNEEFDAVLTDCKVQIDYRLFINDEYLINMYEMNIYPVSEILDVSKSIRSGNKGARIYTVNITTNSFNDKISFGRRERNADSAYRQIKALSYSNGIKNDRNNFSTPQSDNSAQNYNNPYENMIMDEDDIKDKSDWLGSL